MDTTLLALYAAAGLLELAGVLTVVLEIRRSRRELRRFDEGWDPDPVRRSLDSTTHPAATWAEVGRMPGAIRAALGGNGRVQLVGVLLLIAGLITGTVANALSV